MTASALGLSLEQTRRYARQIALPEIGAAGQIRLGEAAVALVLRSDGADGQAGEVAAEFLAAAGVGKIARLLPAPRGGGEAWLQALTGCRAVMRFSFDDDPLLRAAVRLALPAVFAQAQPDRIDVVSFRRHGPCPHLPLEIPTVRAAGSDTRSGAAAPLAAALVATELLGILVAPDEGPRARVLRLPLGPGSDGGLPQASEIPWAPECFICGGRSQEALLFGGQQS